MVKNELDMATAHVNFCMKLCEAQRLGGRYFLLEQPAESAAWKIESLMEAMARDDAYRVKFDMCRYGMTCEGKPVRKPTAMLTNSFEIARRVQRRCHDRMLG